MAEIPIAPAASPHHRYHPEDNSPQHRKRKRVACKQCRQAKLRCDGQSEAGCERCREADLECVYDNQFKRMNKRLKVQELVDEVQQLRTLVQSDHAASPTNDQSVLRATSGTMNPVERNILESPQNYPSSAFTPVSLESNVTQSTIGASPILARNPGIEDARPRPAATCSRSLDSVTVTSSQIDHLYQIYFESYHPHFPTLDPSISPDRYYSWSSVLFWVTIAIASRRDEQNSTLLGILAPSVRDLLWKNMGSPPQNKHTIKAWTLICIWPFPTSSMSTDPSYTLASAAKSSAMHVGLHRPEIVQDFSRVKIRFSAEELHDASRTWVGCFIAAESVTSSIGQPSLFQSDPTIEFLAASQHHESLSSRFMAILQILKLMNRVHQVMSSIDMASRQSSNEIRLLIPMLEREANSLRVRMQPVHADIEFLMNLVVLHLCCYYFFEEPGSASKKEGLLKGYAVALAVAERAHNAQREQEFFSYAPEFHYAAVALSAMFILKITRSAYSQDINVAEAQKCFNFCHLIIRQTSLENNDLRGRTAKILSQLWHADMGEEIRHEPSLKIRTRLSGCLLHDLMWQWRERFGNEKSRRPSPTPISRAHDSTQPVASQTSHDVVNPMRTGPLAGDVVNSDHGPAQNQAGLLQPMLTGSIHPESHNAIATDQPQVSPSNVAGSLSDPMLDLDLMPMPTGYVGSYWDTMLDDLFSEDTF